MPIQYVNLGKVNFESSSKESAKAAQLVVVGSRLEHALGVLQDTSHASGIEAMQAMKLSNRNAGLEIDLTCRPPTLSPPTMAEN